MLFGMPFHNLKPYFDADKGGGGGGGGTSDDSDKKTDADADKKFTQADLDRIAGETRKAGREGALKELFEKHGVKDEAELKTKLDALSKAETDKLGEVDKAKKLADDEKARADKLAGDLEATNASLKKLTLQREFGFTARTLELKFSSTQAEADAFALADLSKVKLDGDKVEGMEEAVKELQKVRPYLFGEGKPGVPEIDAKNGKGGKKTDADAIKRRFGLS